MDRHRWDRARVDAYWDGLVPSVGDDAGFSWHPCESCGRPLGGDRLDVSWFSMDDPSERGSGTICVDCAMYLANGDVPEDSE